MNRRLLLPLAGLLGIVTVLSAAVSLLVVRSSRIPSVTDTRQFDEWLHQQLGVSEEQEAGMAANETAFHQRQEEIVLDLGRLNRELARAVVEDRAQTPRIEDILRQISTAHAELQRLTLAHVFDMREHLTPAQYERLLTLTANALEEETPAPAHQH